MGIRSTQHSVRLAGEADGSQSAKVRKARACLATSLKRQLGLNAWHSSLPPPQDLCPVLRLATLPTSAIGEAGKVLAQAIRRATLQIVDGMSWYGSGLVRQ